MVIDTNFPMDTNTHRVCGECGELKPFSAFYKDGNNPDGSERYRRDCKECYKLKRNRAKAAKKKIQYNTKPRRKR